MTKMGQVTIFIIIAVILVGAVVIFFMLINPINKTVINPQVEDVYSFVGECLEETAFSGSVFIASRGGFFNLPDNYFTGIPQTSYWIYNGEDISPNLNTIGAELSKYINNQLGYCLGSWESADKQVEFGGKETIIKIRDDKILIFLNMLTSVKLGNSTSLLEDYKLELEDTKLFRSFKASKEILEEIKKDSEVLSLASLFHIADESGFDLIVDSYDESTYILKLNDRAETSYSFNFVVNIK